MPEQIVEACWKRELVIFAGAGTSTESDFVLPVTLFSHIHELLGMGATERETFPALMARYESRHGRPALLRQIKERLDYIRSFPQLEHMASRFHRALASCFPVTDVITTNWDDYFERYCGATPYVTEKDWAFWNQGDRKVFKLHGSLANPGSVVATTRDYQRCYREFNQGLIGATLKTMLATKTVVFAGYSFGDADFNAVYKLLKRRMQDLIPRAYVVTLDDSPPPPPLSALHVIRTDATYFIERLKQEMPEGELIPDERLDEAEYMAMILSSVHHQMLAELPIADHPAVGMCALYQDGLIHAFEHQHANRGSGNYSHRCYVEGMIDTYETLRGERLRHRQYGEVAYIDGYLAGLCDLIRDGHGDRAAPFYVFGNKERLMRLEDFLAVAANAEKLHKGAYREALRIARRAGSDGMVLHHLPMLLPADGRTELIDPPLELQAD